MPSLRMKSMLAARLDPKEFSSSVCVVAGYFTGATFRSLIYESISKQ